jgi:hypothetical protein
MPPYYRVDGLTRVGGNWAGKPILTAEQIEDVVAFLSTLRDWRGEFGRRTTAGAANVPSCSAGGSRLRACAICATRRR